jgi:acyl dehydratase
MATDVPSVGTQLPEFVRTPGLEHWNRYAAANNEFVPIHMDDEAGRAVGFPSAFGMGNLLWAYLHILLREWMGLEARIIELKCEFRSPNVKGMRVSAHGVVREVDTDSAGSTVTIDVWTQDDHGKKLSPGTAVVRYSV